MSNSLKSLAKTYFNLMESLKVKFDFDVEYKLQECRGDIKDLLFKKWVEGKIIIRGEE